MAASAISISAAPRASRQRQAVLAAITCGVAMAFGPAVLFLGTFALFLGPVSKASHWGSAVYPGGLFLSGIVAALIGPVGGRLMDRFGVRIVVIPSLLLWVLALGGLSYVEGSPARLYADCTLMGVAQACFGPIAIAKVIAGWFDRTRGLVLGLALGAAPAAGTVIALFVVRQLILSYGWEAAYRLSALAVLVIALPLIVLFLREAPEVAPDIATGAAPQVTGMRLIEALRTRPFWLVMVSGGICCGAALGVNGHLMAWSVERSVNAGLTTAALSAYSIAGPIGALISGLVADRVKSPKWLAGFYLMPFAGVAALSLGGQAMLVPGLVLLGLGFAAGSGLTPFLATRYFGLKYASEILGVVLGALQMLVGLGPVLIGLARDSMGSYIATMPAVAAVSALPFLLALALPRYGRGRETGAVKPPV